MINNDYPFSLLLGLRLQSIDHLTTYCPLHVTAVPKLHQSFEEVCDTVLKQGNCPLVMASENITVNKDSLNSLVVSAKEMLQGIDEELLRKKRKNVLTALEFLKIEFSGLITLLENHEEKSVSCDKCNGSGLNAETQAVRSGYYGDGDGKNGWEHSLNQDDVQMLWDKGRLHRSFETVPTAEQVNAWSHEDKIGHDAINRELLVRYRAEKAGVFGYCEKCGGDGSIPVEATVS